MEKKADEFGRAFDDAGDSVEIEGYFKDEHQRREVDPQVVNKIGFQEIEDAILVTALGRLVQVTTHIGTSGSVAMEMYDTVEDLHRQTAIGANFTTQTRS